MSATKERSREEAATFKGMGMAVLRLRESRRLSKAGLAAKADIGSSTLLAIEEGDSDAQWGTLRRLAAALDTPLDALIKLADELAPGRETLRAPVGGE